MGHVLGYEHTDSSGLMSATLPLGQRRLSDNVEGSAATEADLRDLVFASLQETGKRRWSWL